LYDNASQAVFTAEAQGKRNKLSARDINHLRIYAKKTYAADEKISVRGLTEEANRTKEGTATVGATTVWNTFDRLGLACDARSGNWPRQISYAELSGWLSRRRQFCKVMKSIDKSRIIMADESFFGLKAKQAKYSKETHPIGQKRQQQYEPQYAKDRITVWAAIGLDFWTEAIIFEDGQYLNGEQYAKMLDTQVLPKLCATRPKKKFIEDNCRIHNCKVVQAVWDRHNIDHEFLGRYWKDLNWTEKFWANVKEVLYDGRRRTFSNKAELITPLRSAWTTVAADEDYRRRLVASFEDACKKVIEAQGYLVHWD
jgi:hypothetical protein